MNPVCLKSYKLNATVTELANCNLSIVETMIVHNRWMGCDLWDNMYNIVNEKTFETYKKFSLILVRLGEIHLRI